MSKLKHLSVDRTEFSGLMKPYGPFERYPTLAVAYSGGSDSTALLFLADRWARQRRAKVVALTVDHGLRPESKQEVCIAQKRCQKLGIESHLLRWLAPKINSGIQNAARNARYSLLSDWCKKRNILHLLVAHNLEDQAETILHRLGRRTGLDGLAGMPAVREMKNIRLVRPCINVSRQRLRATLNENNIKWLEDPSNNNLSYARVRLRRLLPTLTKEQISPTMLSGTARRLSSVRRSLERNVSKVLAENAMMFPEGYSRIARKAFSNSETEIARRVLEILLCSIGGSLYPPNGRKVDRLLQTLKNEIIFKPRTLGGCKIALKDHYVLIFREAKRCQNTIIRPGETIFWDGRFFVRIGIKNNLTMKDYFLGSLGGRSCPKIRNIITKMEKNSAPKDVLMALPVIRDLDGIIGLPDFGYGRKKKKSVSLMQVVVQFAPQRPVTNANFFLV